MADAHGSANAHPDAHAEWHHHSHRPTDLLAGRSPGRGGSGTAGVPAGLVDGAPDSDVRSERVPDANPDQ